MHRVNYVILSFVFGKSFVLVEIYLSRINAYWSWQIRTKNSISEQCFSATATITDTANATATTTAIITLDSIDRKINIKEKRYYQKLNSIESKVIIAVVVVVAEQYQL